MAYEDLTQAQRTTLESLSGRSLPVSGGFGSGQALPSDPRAIYNLLQWTPERYASYFGTLTTPGEPTGYGFFTDLSLYSEAIPRYTGQVNPYGALTETLSGIGNDYFRNMIRTYGNNYFNSQEKEMQRDQRDLWIRRISAAVIAVAAWGAGTFYPTGAEGTAGASTSGATVAQSGTIDPTYFGFEPGTYQSIGVSEYAFGPQTLTPSTLQSFAGASAYAQPSLFERAQNSLTSSLDNTVRTGVIAKPLAELGQAIVRETGSIGQAIGRIFSGDIIGGFRQLFGGGAPTPLGPSQNPLGTSFSSGGGGGGSYLTNDRQTSLTGVNIFVVVGGVLLVVWLLLRKRG